jgi:DNA-binding transcriptional regulator YiaG
MKEGSKYYPLFTYLKESGQDEVLLTLSQIETLLNTSLPRSAWTHRGWWSNRSKGALQAAAWMDAGYHVTDLNLDAERVTFARPKLIYTVKQVGDTVLWDRELIKALRQHMRLTQVQLAEELGVRHQTISEWETGAYSPSRATSKYLSLVAERAGFQYEVESEESSQAEARRDE